MEGSDDGFLEAAGEAVAALDNLPLPAALLDERGAIRWQNKASVALRGRLTGRHFAGFLEPEAREVALEVFTTLLEQGQPTDLDVLTATVGGATTLVEARLSVVPIHDGTKAVLVLNMAERIDADALRAGQQLGVRQLDGLSPRQRDVLRLLAAGMSTDEISKELALRPTTVRNHVANLLAELGVHSRLQAVVVARNIGLIE